EDETTALTQRRFNRIGQSLANIRANNQTIDHQIDLMLLVTVQWDIFFQAQNLAVYSHAHKSRLTKAFKELLIGPNSSLDERRHDLDLCACREFEYLFNDLLSRLRFYFTTAFGAVRLADPGVEQPKIVINLRHCSDGRAGVVRGGALFN